MALLINVRHLEEKDIRLDGSLTPAELALEATDELVQLRQPLHYDLTVHQAGRNVLVSGQLEVTLDCECARCLKPFSQELKLVDWALPLTLDGPEKVELKNDTVDLTPYLREDILLEFPQHPLCNDDCAGLPNRLNAGNKNESPGQLQNGSAWAELNKLKF
jgi:uncharacterized protein